MAALYPIAAAAASPHSRSQTPMSELHHVRSSVPSCLMARIHQHPLVRPLTQAPAVLRLQPDPIDPNLAPDRRLRRRRLPPQQRQAPEECQEGRRVAGGQRQKCPGCQRAGIGEPRLPMRTGRGVRRPGPAVQAPATAWIRTVRFTHEAGTCGRWARISVTVYAGSRAGNVVWKVAKAATSAQPSSPTSGRVSAATRRVGHPGNGKGRLAITAVPPEHRPADAPSWGLQGSAGREPSTG
jgi:hypothetical protein